MVYGIIIMEKGVPVSSIDSLAPQGNLQLYQDIVDNLCFIHSCGVLHCDIRLANILNFPRFGKYKLIDYDLSTIMKKIHHQSDVLSTPEMKSDDDGAVVTAVDDNCEYVSILRNSGQANYCPYSIRSQFLPSNDNYNRTNSSNSTSSERSSTNTNNYQMMSVKWGPADDMMMFTEYLLKKYQYFPSSTNN